MRFDPEKGMIQFVFANEDRYYLPSLIRLDLKRYLYMLLRRQGYEGIFFVEEEEKGLRLTMSDGASLRICEAVMGKRLYREVLRKWFRGAPDRPAGGGGINGNEAQIFRLICRLMRARKHLAFVFPVEIFDRIGAYPDVASAFSEESKGFLRKRHLLLIQAPANADVARQYFAPENSVFRSGLIPEIQAVYEAGSRTPVYEELVRKMGERICFLNRMDREAVHSMIRRFFLMEGRNMDVYMERAKDYADFIWAWYHSRSFREAAGPILPANEKRQLQVVYRYLNEEPAFSSMDQSMVRLGLTGGQSVADQIVERFEMDADPIRLYDTDPMLKAFERFAAFVRQQIRKKPLSKWQIYPMGRLDEEAFYKSRQKVLDDLAAARNALGKPRIGYGDKTGEDVAYRWGKEASACMEQCMAAGKAAAAAGDMETVERSVKALLYMTGPDLPDPGCARAYMETLKLGGELFEETKREAVLKAKVAEKQAELVRSVEAVKKEKEQYPDVLDEIRIWKGGSKDEKKLSAKAEKTLYLLRKVKTVQTGVNSMKRQAAACAEKIDGYRQAICQMDNAIGYMTMTPSVDVKEALDNARDQVEKIMKEWWIA